jgi:hypothetical protein
VIDAGGRRREEALRERAGVPLLRLVAPLERDRLVNVESYPGTFRSNRAKRRRPSVIESQRSSMR